MDDIHQRMAKAEELLPGAPRWAVAPLLEVHYWASQRLGSHSGLRYHPCMDRFMSIMSTTQPPNLEEVDDRKEREKWALLMRCSAHLYRQRDRSESSDLELAIVLSRKALLYVLQSGGEGSDLIDCLGIWVSSLNILVERVSLEGDLRDAAEELKQLAQLLHDGAPQLGIAEHFLGSAGLVLRLIHGQCDDAESLDAAIHCFELALRGQPHPRPGDGADPKITWYANLSTALKYRYMRDREPRDYEAAVAALETAMGRSASGADRAQLLMQMSQLRSIRAGYIPTPQKRKDLHRQSGEAAQRAMEEIARADQPGYEPASKVPVVAFMQSVWFRAESGRYETDLTPDPTRVPDLTPGAVQWVLNHAVSRFEASRNLRVLDATATVFAAAARRSDPAGSERADMLLAQAMVLHVYPRAADRSMWDRSRELVREASCVVGARPVTLAQANILLGIGSYAERRYTEGADSFEEALNALASLRQADLDLDQQLRRIAAASGMVPDEGLVSLAAGCAIAAGDGQRALALVEKGMTLFSDQGAPVQPLELPQLTAAGPIVSVVASGVGAHALVATSSGVEIVSLAGLSDAEWSLSGDAGPESVISDLLEVLWDSIGVPVLTNLAEQAIHPRRIWWLPVGKMAVLPLHAAGYHRARDGRSLLDRTVSSYLASLDTLARYRSTPTARPDLTNALVAAFPGQNSQAKGYLLSACAEAKAVAAELGAPAPLLKGDATVAAVLTQGERSAVAHYVCHGSADLLRPTKSGLDLADGRLTVGQLAQRRRNDVWLAYLSACETARQSNLLIAPTLTIGAAFHQAGHRHVIGTLAPIYDDVAAAKGFYRHLKAADPAAALHQAVKELRDELEDQPTRWSSLIHFGPEA